MATSIYLGTQGWSYKSWVGTFYPADAKAADFLAEYSRRFSAVEIDSTFYGTPRPDTVKQWYSATPDNFRFTAKFPQEITHTLMLQGAERETAHFLATIALLGEKLGPLLLQFPHQFKPEQHALLDRFLESLPSNFKYAVELRHREWFNDDLFEMLEKRHVALALTDYAYAPKMEQRTTDFTYIRWLGSRKEIADGEYDQVRINRDNELGQWSDLIKKLAAKSVTVWGFANNHYQGHSPATVRSLMERLAIPQSVPVRRQPKLPVTDEDKEKERRAQPRVDATYRIAYECFNPWGIKVDEGPAKTVDISGRGALIEIPRGVPLDASMVLLVMAPFHMLMVKGSVVHSRRSDNGTYHVGVHLTEVVEGSWDILDWVIKERLAEKADWVDTSSHARKRH